MFYGKQEARIVSGVAIVMMMIHHFFGFPDYLLPENHYISLFSFGDITVERLAAAFGKLCVAIFAFNSGYVLWQLPEKFSSWRQVSGRLIHFMESYWFVCAIFLVIGILSHDRLPDIAEFVRNLFGLSTGPAYLYVNVVFGWYVAFYISWLLLSPVLCALFNKSGGVIDLFLLVVLGLAIDQLVSMQLDFLVPLKVALCGLLTAKYNVFEWLHRRWNVSAVIALFIIIIMIPIRQGLIFLNVPLTGFEDGLFAAVFIYAVVVIARCRWMSLVNKVFLFLGAYSMNMWYFHGLFFTGSKQFQWLLYWPEYSILILLWGIVMTLMLSIACDYLFRGLNFVFAKKIMKKK